VLILAGLIYIVSSRPVFADRVTAVDESSISKNNSSIPAVIAGPVRVVVPDLDIDLAVEVGVYDKSSGQWNIDSQNAYFAVGAATPLIYAHNRAGLFSSLRNINEGTKLMLRNDDGSSAQYIYSKTRIVSKDDGSVLTEKNLRTVILLTCSGLFDETRRLVYFKEQS
jgi:LPXTG-site transpeptidase (sortase) family protein